ncbi:TRAP transporter solute receptor, TAXI family [Parafrankia irregularis]|uniref:non-specific serine/threonine protein kinase n=1 Tax=Parafrankia irregularis TaxID=795642 RepID=A0A0S4QY71_9ACTN|nr:MULTISPECIES: TAXI family TRAP transporter solute-binding subunit [Parafrankia]MBE3202790.1 TAXI family TRAP transporter solute-binding subunit [Parafrankia sp. CH37]CUU60046.1 TRAP transporter solute receptor, TAXI family [Parafrankia irregularis]
MSSGDAERVFISAADADRGWAQWIALQLRQAGYIVEYERSWQAEASFPANMDRALARADKIVAVVSPVYFDQSTYGLEAAVGTAQNRDGVLVPVLVAPTTLPPLFGRLSHVSLLGLDEEEAQQRLLSGVRGIRPTRPDEGVLWPGGVAPTRQVPSALATPPPAPKLPAPFPGRIDMLADQVARALPQYELGERLGAGSFGVVFEGRHRALNRRVAVKVLSADREDSQARYSSEARVLANLDHHAHVVRVYDYVEQDELHMIIMELLPGGTLTRRRRRLSQPDACAVGLAVAEALSHVHRHNVLHRDIKPDNMLFDNDGLLKVTDFGIAKIFDGSGANASAVVGTPKYMAPEQISGERLGPSTDLYSLAAVLYELLSGQPLFGQNLSVPVLYNQHLNVVPPPPAGVPSEIGAVVVRALAKQAEQRHPSARAFALDLAAAARESFGQNWLDSSAATVQLSEEVRKAVTGPPPGGHPGARSRTSSTSVSVPASGGGAAVGDTPPTTVSPPAHVPSAVSASPSDPESAPVPVPAPTPTPGDGGRGGRRAWLAVGLAVVVALATLGLVVLQPDDEPPAVLGGCTQVTVFSGGEGTPYDGYGTVLADLIEDAYPGTSANNVLTAGSAANLESVRIPANARCLLAVSQLNTAVDAFGGTPAQFPTPIKNLRIVGPLGFDLVHLVVRRDAGFTRASDLCGRQVLSGPTRSGTFQIGSALFRVLGCAGSVRPEEATLTDQLARVRRGAVDAVLWAGGSPTAEIRESLKDGEWATLLPTGDSVGPMINDWNSRVGTTFGPNFVSGDVYTAETILPSDYPGVGRTMAVAVPNGVVANQSADPALVAFVARALFDDRSRFEAALWADGSGGRHFPTAAESVARNPVYCLVPLHPSARTYYAENGSAPGCAAGT